MTRARRCSELLSDKSAKHLCVAVVTQALKDLTDQNPGIADDAREWLFSEHAAAVFDGAGFFSDDIRWQVRRMIRQGTVVKAA